MGTQGVTFYVFQMWDWIAEHPPLTVYLCFLNVPQKSAAFVLIHPWRFQTWADPGI